MKKTKKQLKEPTALKVVISSKTNLVAKYNASNFIEIDKHLKALIKADAARNVFTKIVYIDDKDSAKSLSIKNVERITPKSVKEFVDKLFKNSKFAYLMIFGSQDIIPFQNLTNITDDDDPNIPSDLPYACEAAYSNDVSNFVGPTRVVGRVPDIPGQADMKYISNIFNQMINYKSVPQQKLYDYFAITADVWKASTDESLRNIFGNSTVLKSSPPSIAGSYGSELKALTHFYNCHGAPLEPEFYGQLRNNYPVAISSNDLNGNLEKGAIVAAECCYGAAVYNPANVQNNIVSIPNTYFNSMASAFVGSSNIAYGPARGQGLADLITQYFIQNVIEGSSTGRSFLEARLRFISKSAPTLDPHELKTLAQFYLLGDPSIVATQIDKHGFSEDTVENRRTNLVVKGLSLAEAISKCRKVKAGKTKLRTSDQVKGLLKKFKFSGDEKASIYNLTPKNKLIEKEAKSIGYGGRIQFQTYTKKSKQFIGKMFKFDILVIKMSNSKVLGHQYYQMK